MTADSNTINIAIQHRPNKSRVQTFCLDLNLQLPGKGITAIFGESGSGKTTLLRCLAGLEKMLGGEIHVKGLVWQSGSKIKPIHERRVGYVFQESSLFPHLSVEQNIDYGVKRSPVMLSKPNYEKIIELMGLYSLLERFPEQLSGGERQRVAIARALLIEPDILLMDEPLASLDGRRKQEIMPYLESMHEKLDVPIIYVTHSIDEVARLADHLVVLQGGTVMAEGPLGEVLANTDLPIKLGEDTGVVFEARVAERDDDWNLLRAEFLGGELWVRDGGDSLDQSIRIRVLARDVSLALSAHTDTSIINRLWGRIEKIHEDEDRAMLLVRLVVGEVRLLARVSRRSAHQLAIKIGDEVWAQIKGVAILR
ncbi:MAG: molybdenum ABC transporter ATP-binding protein [Gammaproteobacteria bacterium]|nr:molybdenum ABC transporter ATP-binding protein [Gammaproteobacteria bacterium]